MFTTGYRRVVAVVAATVLVAAPTAASARPAPNSDDTGVVQNTPSPGRTDQQFWGEATWENPESGLNLDRNPTARSDLA